MKQRQWIVAVAFSVLSMSAMGQSASVDTALGKVEKTFQNWEVRASINPMTDERTCVAIPQGSPRIQATQRMLAISFKGKGGVKGYEYRLDDKPVSPMKVASDIERDVSAVIFEGNDFSQVLSSNRLRIQVVPVLRGLHFEDINTQGLSQAVQYMRDSCKR